MPVGNFLLTVPIIGVMFGVMMSATYIAEYLHKRQHNGKFPRTVVDYHYDTAMVERNYRLAGNKFDVQRFFDEYK